MLPRILAYPREPIGSAMLVLWIAFQCPSEVSVFFSVQDLEQRQIRFDVSLAPGEIDYLDDSLRQRGPLKATGIVELLQNTLGEIRVRGHVNVTIETACDRCLEQARFPIDSGFDLFYRPPRPSARPEEVELHEGEAEIGFYEGGGLQLNDILREYVILSLPMHTVCSETCRGICPVCGENRNLLDCGCEVKPADDRWAALKRLQN